MSMTTIQITESLKSRFAGHKFCCCTRRNGRPSDGWCVPGNAKWTRSVKAANLPYNKFWSGSAPTPSTQYPVEIYDYLKSIDNNN